MASPERNKQPDETGRVARRRKRNRAALIAAGRAVMAEKGIDAATMSEIAERADVGAGTVYTFFRSKDELAIAVLENLMHDLALRIEKVTNTFDDPAQVYAYGLRTVIDEAIGDPRWRQLLNRSEVISDAMCRMMGPFATRDIDNATRAGRFHVADAELTLRLAAYGIMGFALAVSRGELPADQAEETVVNLLAMTGIGRDEAEALARRPRPPLPPG